MKDDERISKLPVWAQNHIAKLKGDASFYKKKYETFLGEQKTDGDTIYIESYISKSIPLPQCSLLIKGHGIRLSVTERGVRVSGDDLPISVIPDASNSIYVATRKW